MSLVMYFYIFIYIIANCPCNVMNLNVGTVLFTESDIAKECWSSDDVALLTTRMFLEDILPDTHSLNIHDNMYVNDLVEYFRLLLDIVRKDTHGKANQITLHALIDALGGYLYRYVLPTARYSYYAGYINYGSIEKLGKLFDELKCFLRTNGRGWIKSRGPSGVRLAVEPLELPLTTGDTNPCNTLAVIEREIGCVEIPLPFLDSPSEPAAIALPFKAHPLLKIDSKEASYVLVKYYIAATKCLTAHNANQTDTKRFTNSLFHWIQSQIVPLLNHEKFYSAFGGVLRILETLKTMGVRNEKQMGNYNIMPEMQVKDAAVKYDMDETTTDKKKSDLILMALLATIFIWFLLGSIFICYRIKAGRKRLGDGAALLSINTCSCKSSSKHSTTSASEGVTSSASKNETTTDSATTVESKRRLVPKKNSSHVVRRVVCYKTEGEVRAKSDRARFVENSEDRNSPSGLGVQTSFSDRFEGSSFSGEISADRIMPVYNIESSSSESAM
ncbi:hypothetical protein PPYR_03283 [Photinus pyralis]|uniref:Uncharacterized protein n=2 Tax=Photinus pyralis TaxID=7054 RepID=A0A5N4A2D3_PHOPY|nr:uncharacterized protein LOC116162366 [Photinus pyralis]KAB0791483.1 hypothetical protein PPYR_03283 [Photinus pyralis]